MQTHPSSSTPAPWNLAKTVLDEAEFRGQLHLLAPGAEYRHDRPAPGERVLFVAGGSITVDNGRTNFVLQPETALRQPPGAACVIRNHDTTLTKVFILDLPPPRPARRPEDWLVSIG